MSVDPKNDPTSLGSILLKMGVLTQEELEMAVEMQERSSKELQLGNQLVAYEVCTREQIDIALRAQEQMRSEDNGDQALGVADIAQYRRRATSDERKKLVSRADEVVRKATGQVYPAVTAPLLAKPSDG